jgi:hypothetical protein
LKSILRSKTRVCRWRGALLGAAWIVGACSSNSPADGETSTAGSSATATAGATATGANADAGASTTAGAPPAHGGASAAEPIPTGDLCVDAPADLATSKRRSRSCSLGDDARFFVRGAPYTQVVIEIGSTQSATPSPAATAHLQAVMSDLLDKPGGVSVKVDEAVEDVGHPLSLEEAAAIEDASRTEFTLGDTVVFYYLVVSDGSTDDTSSATILGYAYRPSSMVVFQHNINASAGGLGQPSRDVVESTVVAHEFGHILGLVNTGTPMQKPHEDSEHPKHDQNSACLMYWANNSSEGLANLLSGGKVPDYDAACRADIAALNL